MEEKKPRTANPRTAQPRIGENGKAAKDILLEDVDPLTVQAKPEALPKEAGDLRVASVNVNGLRAAWRKGMPHWLQNREVDVLALQEVRAPDAVVQQLLAEHLGDQWQLVHAEAVDKGRAGVAIASRIPFEETRIGIGDEYFQDSGRWVEADIRVNGQLLTLVSAYVHSGEVDTQKQIDKYRFLDRMLQRLPELAEHADHALVVGDLNVGHRELDIKNWKANRKKAGFLPEERAYFDRFFGELGYRDVLRELAGEVEGPYTWWSQRGQAFTNDVGWRIDYHMATADLGAAAQKFAIDRGARWDTRFTDHAPLVIDYRL